MKFACGGGLLFLVVFSLGFPFLGEVILYLIFFWLKVKENSKVIVDNCLDLFLTEFFKKTISAFEVCEEVSNFCLLAFRDLGGVDLRKLSGEKKLSFSQSLTEQKIFRNE